MNFKEYKVVIAKYNEEIDWIRFLNPDNVIVYDKSDTPILGSIHKKNIGRESETFLSYIVDNYDKLPEYVIFLQGSPFDHFEMSGITKQNLEYNITSLLNKNPDTTPLFRSMHYEDISLFKGLNISQYYNFLFNKDSPKIIGYSCGCQYIIPKHRILYYSKSFYLMLHSMIINSILTYEDVHSKTPKFDSSYISPWTFERISYVLFSNSF